MPNFESITLQGNICIVRHYGSWYPMRKTETGNLAFLQVESDKHDGSRESAERIAKQHFSTPVTVSLDEFTSAYIETALWSSTDSSDQPLDHNYDASNLAPATLERMIDDCARFQVEQTEWITSEFCQRYGPDYGIDGRAGHDFWLTRNGHGAGFWDGDWTEPASTKLTEASKGFGECQLYVGDDGRLYI